MPLLAVDVGAGTQDILLFREDVSSEGSSKIVMPSQTVILAGRIDRARIEGRDVFIKGTTMGGGAVTAALRRHLKAGLKVYATGKAALTVNDDLEKVRSMGIKLVEGSDGLPGDKETVEMCDVNVDVLEEVFGHFGLTLPEEVAVAVQDHGYSPGRSNRIFRFEQMAEMIRASGRLEDFAFRDPPEQFNRMNAVRAYLEERGYRPTIMDTGPAALLGATLDPRFQEPGLVLNFGNGHTIGAVISEGRMISLLEHHTYILSPGRIRALVEKLLKGTLENSEVFEEGGHGAYIEDVVKEIGSILVTGPRRHEFLGALDPLSPVISAAPWGDMMIAGSIGLVEAWRRSG